MHKTIEYGSAARNKLKSGAESIAKAVRITLGPSGKNVLIRQKGDQAPFATKDGVTVAAQVYSEDEIEQQAIEAIQEVANNTDSGAGDGTTTAIIIAEAIFRLGDKASDESTNYIELKRGIDVGVHEIVKRLNDISKPCTALNKLKHVAMVSSNNDKEISDIVIDAYKVAGKQGVVNIKRSRTNETYLTTIEGMNLPTGYLSIYFITDLGNAIVELNKPYIYMTNEKITSVTDNLNKLLAIISREELELLIICKDMDPSVLGMLASNRQEGILKVAVCKAPGFGEEQNDYLRDLGVMIGKPVFLESEGIDFNENITIGLEKGKNEKGEDIMIPRADDILKFLPRSEAILITKDRLSIKGPYGLEEKVYKDIQKAKTNRADKLRDSITNEINQYEKSIIQTRISRLTDGIAYINIGAVTDIEYNEKQARIQDALYAVKSASEEGIISGGGTALLYVSKKNITVQDESIQLGIDVVFGAVKEPFVQILNNVGIKITQEQFTEIENNYDKGIDARTGKQIKSMIKHGIIDPVKVTRVALENAASVAGMLLTTDCVIIDNEVYEKNQGMNI